MSNELPSFLQAAVKEDLKMPDEPSFWLPTDVERFFAWAANQKVSDVSIQTDEEVVLHLYGKKIRVTNRKLTHNEVQTIATTMYGGDGILASLAGPKDEDFAYQITPTRDEYYRFRVNVSSNITGRRGMAITARTIPDTPPRLADMGLEQDIFNNMAPKDGMILVAGATGSGKSTLIASMIAHRLEDPDGNLKILTYEAPIEFMFDKVYKPSSIISQTEIPTHLPSFADGTRNALRRAPDIIFVGESRDQETIREAITAAMTGHLLLTTLHARSFPDVIRRMVNVFSADEKSAFATDIASNTKMVIVQKLEKSADKKRVALREFVVFDDQIVDELLSAGPDNMTLAGRKVLQKYGQSFLDDALAKFKEGRITREVLRSYEREREASRRDTAVFVEQKNHESRRLAAIAQEGENAEAIKLESRAHVPGVLHEGEQAVVLPTPSEFFEQIGKLNLNEGEA